jgi:hypothetical protein
VFTRILMPKVWRLLFALALIAGAYGLRAPWLTRDIWNLDEGSTFTMAEQVLHGGVIYRDAADNRSPLVPYLKAAVFAVCGDWNAHAVHVTVALMLGVGAVLLWLTARRLGDEKTGVAGALFFVALTFLMLGLPDALSANTGWFVVFFSIIGYWRFAHAQARPGFWTGGVVGVSFGLATLCKQPGMLDLGVTLMLCGLLWYAEPAQRRARLRLAAGELAGFAIIMAAMVVYFVWQQALGDLAFYAWTFNTKYYVPEVPVWERIWAVRIPFLLTAWNMPAALVAGVGGAILLLRRVWTDLRQRPVRVPLLASLIVGWTAAGLVSTMISGRSFSHYSAQVLPGLGLACGWTVARLLEWAMAERTSRQWLSAGLTALVAAAVVVTGFDCHRRGQLLSKQEDGARETSKLIQKFTEAKDRIFVWGYLPEMYFFSQRLPSTRFIYTNYLTGMIPWTNLNMLVDTTYAVVPGAWQHFWEDLDRQPPAMVVDTGSVRGYLKYPLDQQTRLWEMLTREFALVEYDATRNIGLRVYSRLAALQPGPPPADAPENDRIKVSVALTRRGGSLPMLTVNAPAGVTEIVIWQADRPYRRLIYPLGEPCDAAFFIDRRDLVEDHTLFRAAVHGAGGWRLSHPIDLASYRGVPAKPKVVGPKIKLGDQEILPLEAETFDGGSGFADMDGHRWQAHAPSRFVYDCPPRLARLTLTYGLDEASYQQPDDLGTNGVEVVVSFERPDGGTTQLFWRRLNPRVVGQDRGPQTSRIEIPPHNAGRLIFQFLPGPLNDPAYDWTYWSDLGGQGVGPDLRYGEKRIPAILGERMDGRPMKPDDEGRWAADSPARLIYPFVEGMSSFIFTYGLDDRTYDPARPTGTDGIVVVVEFEHPDFRLEVLFRRFLDPRNKKADRGPQTSRVKLPRETGGRIVVRVEPGPRNDTAFDWAYLANPRAQGPGPDIVWGGRILVPLESRTFSGPGMDQDDKEFWGAHAPSRLVYKRPPDLEAVSFSYGLDPRTYSDPDPHHRTDGIDVLVQFEHADGTVTTLFQRSLTPVSNPDDRGTQSARVELPHGEPGRMLFIITPGPRNDTSYDWSYWTSFIGAP